ncbi:unnamed protein product (macronuclear) [Paramecium tetraurelia]|uniref:Acyltransferase 3 domain-containing protein n=1 Tax=Paramecium tetraurelia TaxID=5888 RepID=A0E2L0_PARTE|nr:uncharacterized protein GSPATT00022699001 [Paramecium tetraurelia]CAK89527.1 unnamed protein product [Paramecium tetraurelia]|eukprot:XP_001456924.1 hypothetical protein (macronuclear) [Paramecium tetraurelia strain d4-2]
MIQTNITSLIQYRPNQMFSLNLLKILAMLSISMSHYGILIGQNDRQSIINSNFMIIMINSLYAVDIFFLISGFILGKKLLTNPNLLLSPIQSMLMILDRIMRIYPLYWILLIIYIILPKLFTNVGYTENCMDNIAYVSTLTHNIFNKFGCFEWSWYIAVEIQTLIFLCLSIPTIHLIRSCFLKSKGTSDTNKNSIQDLSNYIFFLIITVLLYSMAICIQNNYKISFYAMTDKQFYYNFYQKPQYKMSSYLIGLLTGLKYKRQCFANTRYKIIAILAFFFSLLGWILIKEYQLYVADLIQNIYQSISRPILCLGILFSGILDMKSAKLIEQLFQIFSKLLFSIYLSHYFLYQILISQSFIQFGLVPNFICNQCCNTQYSL